MKTKDKIKKELINLDDKFKINILDENDLKKHTSIMKKYENKRDKLLSELIDAEKEQEKLI